MSFCNCSSLKARKGYTHCGYKPGNMENLENSGNLKNGQNLREDSGKFEIFWRKPWKHRENGKYVTHDRQQKLHSIEFSSREFLREKI